MKMIKTRLRNRLSDENLAQLMRIAIEGPEPEFVDFDAIATRHFQTVKLMNHSLTLI